MSDETREDIQVAAALLAQLAEVVRIAHRDHDGHVTLMRFTGGWKVAFGTPDMNLSDRGMLEDIPGSQSLEMALEEVQRTGAKMPAPPERGRRWCKENDLPEAWGDR